MYDRSALIALVRQQALELGQFTLASGRSSHYYLDCRRVTLDSRGAPLIAGGVLDSFGEDWPDAVGGLAIGADPITAAVITLAGQQGRGLKGFIVRKEAKQHGTGRLVEGPVAAGQRAVVVEDTLTTGGSALEAARQARRFGLVVDRVVAIVDRLEGGRQALEAEGLSLATLLTVRDLGIEPLAIGG